MRSYSRIRRAAQARCGDAVAPPKLKKLYLQLRKQSNRFKFLRPIATQGYVLAAVTLDEVMNNALLPAYAIQCSRAHLLNRAARVHFKQPEYSEDDMEHTCYIYLIIFCGSGCVIRDVFRIKFDAEFDGFIRIRHAARERLAHIEPSNETLDSLTAYYNSIRHDFRMFLRPMMKTMPAGYFVAFLTHEELVTHTFDATAVMCQVTERVFNKCVEESNITHICRHANPNVYLHFVVLHEVLSGFGDVFTIRTGPCSDCGKE